jgi:hypothetical protein
MLRFPNGAGPCYRTTHLIDSAEGNWDGCIERGPDHETKKTKKRILMVVNILAFLSHSFLFRSFHERTSAAQDFTS